jgi:hypothetical protein
MPSLWRRLVDTFSATRDAWSQYEQATGYDEINRRYAERWAIYSGSAYSSPMMRHMRRVNPAVYQNTTLLWNHSNGVVGFYETHVYLGGISTDGKPMADGTYGAIPLIPQVDTEQQEADLRLAFAELATLWNWEAKKSEIPRMAAAIGDVLTEIIDDTEHHRVYPQMVWPGYVTDIELDPFDNVIAYALEYDVTEETPAGNVTFRFRKEVDKDEYRYYRDDEPWRDVNGHGDAVQENPYGFVPATWDRHRTGWDERGIAATDSTRQAFHMINSLMSHGIDHQRKVFFAPIIVKGKVFRPGTTKLDLGRAPRIVGTEDAYSRPENAGASFDILAGGENAAIEGFAFDVGKTLEFVRELKDGVLAEQPEGTFYQELRQMGQISGTAAERLLGDSAGRIRLIRANHDIQTIKRFQMAMTIAGMRVNNGDWGAASELRRWQRAFLPYTLESYHRGEMDFRIADRPLIIPTELERIETVIRAESVRSAEGMVRLGQADTIEEAQAILDRRMERYAMDFNRGRFASDYEDAD